MAQKIGGECHLLLTNGDYQLSENYRKCSGQSRWRNSFWFSEHPAWVAVAKDFFFSYEYAIQVVATLNLGAIPKLVLAKLNLILTILRLVLAILNLVLAV